MNKNLFNRSRGLLRFDQKIQNDSNLGVISFSRRQLNLYLVKTDDVGVLQQLHDLHLSEDLFQVLIIQLGLIHYFYCHLESEEKKCCCIILP